MDMATKPSNHNLNGWFLFPTSYTFDEPYLDLSLQLSCMRIMLTHLFGKNYSSQETPRPLQPKADDGLLPRRVLQSRS